MESYKSARDAARRELAQLAIQRERIDRRIANLKRFLESTEALFEHELLTPEAAHLLLASMGDDEADGTVSEGITDAIKRVFMLNDSLTPVEVKDQLILMGFDLRKHNNPMANIHSVLKRLVEQEWLEQVEKDDKQEYRRRMSASKRAAARILSSMKELDKEAEMLSLDAFSGQGSSVGSRRVIRKKKD